MAAELQIRSDTTGATIAATISKALTVGGKIQKYSVAGSAWEDMTVANWANYLITMTETPASSYWYVGTWPAALTTVGWYYVNIYAGTAISSTLIGTQYGYWDGTHYHLDAANIKEVVSVAQTGGDIVAKINTLNTAVVAGVAASLTATASGGIGATTGIEQGGTTYANTYLSNGVYWSVRPGSSSLAVYLDFLATATQYVNSITIRGFFQNTSGSSRYVNVFAYNWTTSGWDQISDSVTRMNHATTNQLYNYTILSAHKNPTAGADQYKVRIRFVNGATNNANDQLNVDQCLVNIQVAVPSAADIANAVWLKTAVLQYEGGVWVDTVAVADGGTGVAGTSISDGNGSPTKPCLTYDEAIIVADTLGVKRMYLKPGAVITLSQTHAKWRFIGAGTIHLGGQIITEAVFENIYEIDGLSTGEEAEFTNCGIVDAAIYHAYFTDCRMRGTLTMKASVENAYYFFGCSDASGNGSTAIFVYDTNVSCYFRKWSGEITIKEHHATSETIIDGAGRIIIDATSHSGDIVVRGSFGVIAGATGNTFGTSGTITQSARYGVDQTMADTTGTTELLTRVPNLSVATSTGNWGSTGTWLGGVCPVAGDNIIIRDGIVVTVAANLNLGIFGTLELQGICSIDIDTGITVETVPIGWAIGFCYGTVTHNYGTIDSSEGEVGDNDGTIFVHSGNLSGYNTGVIKRNVGTININGAPGTIEDNAGDLAANYYFIDSNQANGHIVQSLYSVRVNHGLIDNNTGIVEINTGTIGHSYAGCTVQSNSGTVTLNDSGGKVFNSLGGVVTTNNGSVYSTEISCDAALVANNLDHLALTATGIPTLPAGTYLDQARSDGTGAAYDRTTDSQQAIRDRGDAAWVTATTTAASNLPADYLSTQEKADLASILLATNTGKAPGVASGGLAVVDANQKVAATGNWYTGTPPTADAIGTDAASKILATPANKLVTDGTGRVTTANPGGSTNASDFTGSFPTLALRNAPAANVVLNPVVGVVPANIQDVTLANGYQYGAYSTTLAVIDANGFPVVLTGRTLEMEFADSSTPTTKVFSILTTGSSGDNLVIDGTTTNQVGVAIATTHTATPRVYTWVLWDVTNAAAPIGLIHGTLHIGTNPQP